MTDLDRTKIYYKFVRDNYTHNDFVYKLGLNIDHLPFYPNDSCKPGGLYFTDLEHILEFSNYGNLVAEIELPDNARIYKDPNGNKWKTDRFIIKQFNTIEIFFEDEDDAFFLMIVKKNSEMLRSIIKKQTEEICLEAVK